MPDKHRLGTIAPLVLLMGLVGCGGSGSVTTPSAPAPGAASPLIASGSAVPLSSEVNSALDHALQDEYHAENIYLGVLADFGDVRPFFNVVRAEQRHSASIVHLYENRGLAAPASGWTIASVPHFGSPEEACAAAVTAEQDNVALYDVYLALDLPRDVRNVFENNRAASLERHLPAFQACACSTCPVS